MKFLLMFQLKGQHFGNAQPFFGQCLKYMHEGISNDCTCVVKVILVTGEHIFVNYCINIKHGG